MISFIVPVYNEEKYIARTLENLKGFNLVPHEIIVSDDGSSDQTVEIARKYADQVVAWQRLKNPTIGAARNRGAAVAKYPYLVFIDSTVRIPELNKFFSIALEDFKNHPKLVGLAVNVQVEPQNATFFDRFFFGMMDRWYQFNNNFLKFGMAQGKFQMVKTEIYKKTGGFSETLVAGEDIEFFGKLRKFGATLLEPRLTVFHSGRRAHAVGWPKLLFIWMINGIGALIFKRSVSKEWKTIR